MLDFYQKLAIELAQNPVVVATVMETVGSTPREVGAKMIVCHDGRTIDTIGGGAGEAKVSAQALQVLVSGEKKSVEIDLSGALHREIYGVCGGSMQVWLERWDQSYLAIVIQILDSLEAGKPASLITPFDSAQRPFLLPRCIEPFQITETQFIEPLKAPPILLIVGAGHVAIPLAQVAHLAGFQIIVTDDRPMFATLERFPNAIALTDSIESAIQAAKARSIYAALVTRGFQHDVDALPILLRHSLDYIGMIGSRRRVQHVFKTLINQGYAAHHLEKIYAPIGVEIGALTPEEIAVSICAELIQVRRKGRRL